MDKCGGKCTCCAKILLIIVNIFMLLIGLVFLGAGIAVKFAASILKPLLMPLMGRLHPTRATVPDIVNLDIDDILGGLAICFIVIGLIMLIIAIFGMSGTCCGKKTLLRMYAIFIFLLIAIQVTVIIIVASGALREKVKAKLKDMTRTKYGGFDKLDLLTILLNIIMLQLKCCGIDGYADFNNSLVWHNTREITVSSNTVNATLVTPVVCCVMSAPFPNITPVNDTCAITPNDDINNWNKGCYAALLTFLGDNYKWPAVGAISGIMVFELINGIVAIVISIQPDKKDEDEGAEEDDQSDDS